MQRKYDVYIYHVANEDSWCDHVLYTDNPKAAIKKWMRLSKKNYTMVAIDTTRLEYACELIDYAYKNIEWLKEIHTKYRCPYKWEHIEDGVGTKYQTGCDSFHEYKCGDEYMSDQIYPFCLG